MLSFAFGFTQAPAYSPMNMCLLDDVKLQPAHFPIIILQAPLVTFLPEHSPIKILKHPLVPSKSAPASVPATRFLSASGENPARPVNQEPSP